MRDFKNGKFLLQKIRNLKNKQPSQNILSIMKLKHSAVISCTDFVGIWSNWETWNWKNNAKEKTFQGLIQVFI